MNNFNSTFHRDGSVTIWNIFQQQWKRYRTVPSNEVLASLDHKERDRVIRHIKR